jgi:Ran-binding protein 1
MRQNKTMKVLLNHILDPSITLEMQAASDRSWMWSALDFSEGEVRETIFAARFPDRDIANEFKTKIFCAARNGKGTKHSKSALSAHCCSWSTTLTRKISQAAKRILIAL